MACLPTPLQPLKRLGALAPGLELFIKRDDLTGCALSGNKARKLEFLLAEAQRQRASLVITCGGVQSNHARATAVAARQLGMKSLLFLRGEQPRDAQANLLLDLLVGAKIEYISNKQYRQAGCLMAERAKVLEREGERPYIIPEGGSNALGSLGYVLALAEIKEQLAGECPDYLVTAVGSGGTLAGLVMGAQLLQLPRIRLLGINVCASAAYFKSRVEAIVEEAARRFGLPVRKEGNWEIVEGYAGLGYGETQPAELETLRLLAEKEGIFLDPVYTAKAFHGLLGEIEKGRFGKNKKIVFLHTGGIFGLFTHPYANRLVRP